ncbi:hypothetical protein [Amycolatopsis sp. H20-H5]|uniref:hypothetical protein n=1 Tax=Amycolatopsis sp. H20-H5 TaxID=3046309 RepID=UPI002DBDBB37|nr:hypothetical protein [Amycolatopsis sp. H20-H5]MEC3974977.1 hypothetical protein [Amycolatopsis sp. H20-H5]
MTITPTKPLTPSHLKGLLWTDVMYRATDLLTSVTYRYSPSTYHPCEQTLGFWEFLDRTVGEVDYSNCSEDDVGELYVRYRAGQERAPFADCRPYLEAVENSGWVHPASARVLELWAAHYARLGLHNPGLSTHQPPGLGLDEVIDLLMAAGLCLDLRNSGGPVYLDLTAAGLPLRQIVSAEGRPNYLACALRELVPLVPLHDETVLLYDRGLEPDYVLLHKALERLDGTVHRVSLGRVPVDGRITSARQGDWRTLSVRTLLDDVTSRHDEMTVRLGMRLYFIAKLGPGDRESFRADLLERTMTRAERLLAAATGATGDVEYLEPHRGVHQRVDPYRLTSGLLARHRDPPGAAMLAAVYT